MKYAFSLIFLYLQNSQTANKSRPHPVRPAPPPPSSNGWPIKENFSDQTSSTDQFENSFNMPPPNVPAPPPPIDDDFTVDFNGEFESPPPPIPPPRVDSFSNETEEPPLSPWQILPPAPPLPPVLTDITNDEPPPIPSRPKISMIESSLTETLSVNSQPPPQQPPPQQLPPQQPPPPPPPIPSRTNTKPPIIPPRRI